MSIIAAIIASSTSFTSQYTDPGWVDLSGNNNLAAGIVRRDYDAGYFNDDPTWFATQTASATSYPSTIDIGNTLNNPTDIDNYSIEWTGYFVPQTTGNFIFRSFSDDGSHLWIGTSALAATLQNANVSNGGAHGSQYVQGTPVNLTVGHYYPIRVQFGEISGGAQMRVEFSTNFGSSWSTISNMVYDSTTSDGLAV